MLTSIFALLLSAQTGLDEVDLDVGGTVRQELVHMPTKSQISKSGSPVVFMFHGHGGNMRNAARTFQIERYWPEAVVVYPQGLPTTGKTDPQGLKNGWQQNKSQNDDRDLKFFDKSLSDIESKIKVDKTRIYVGGFSNGGRFTYLLWAQRPNVIAAFAPGAAPNIGLDSSPKPAFVIGGEKDPIVPFASQKLSIERIERQIGVKPDETGKTDGFLTVKKGSSGIELDTYIHPGGHVFPKEANPLIVEFFKRNSLH